MNLIDKGMAPFMIATATVATAPLLPLDYPKRKHFRAFSNLK